jgi:hypothetical protein
MEEEYKYSWTSILGIFRERRRKSLTGAAAAGKCIFHIGQLIF